jgi:hypothetical protein
MLLILRGLPRRLSPKRPRGNTEAWPFAIAFSDMPISGKLRNTPVLT